MLPVPTRPEIEIANAWNEETPLSDASPLNNNLTISFKCLTCKNFVTTEKYKPLTKHNPINQLLQTSPPIKPTTCSKLSILLPP